MSLSQTPNGRLVNVFRLPEIAKRPKEAKDVHLFHLKSRSRVIVIIMINFNYKVTVKSDRDP